MLPNHTRHSLNAFRSLKVLLLTMSQPVSSTHLLGEVSREPIIRIWIMPLCSGDEMYGWGDNEQAQLGIGDFSQPVTPVKLPRFSSTLLSVAAGRSHSVALQGRSANEGPY